LLDISEQYFEYNARLLYCYVLATLNFISPGGFDTATQPFDANACRWPYLQLMIIIVERHVSFHEATMSPLMTLRYTARPTAHAY
jgi:hypothetical protein